MSGEENQQDEQLIHLLRITNNIKIRYSW